MKTNVVSVGTPYAVCLMALEKSATVRQSLVKMHAGNIPLAIQRIVVLHEMQRRNVKFLPGAAIKEAVRIAFSGRL